MVRCLPNNICRRCYKTDWKRNTFVAQIKSEGVDNQLVSVLQESMAKLNEKHLNEITIALNEQAHEYAGYVKQQLTWKGFSTLLSL